MENSWEENLMIDQYQNQKQQFNLHIPSFALQVKSEGRVICKIHSYSAPLQTVWCEILIFLETALAGDIWKHAINMPQKANLQNWTTIQQVQSMNIH